MHNLPRPAARPAVAAIFLTLGAVWLHGGASAAQSEQATLAQPQPGSAMPAASKKPVIKADDQAGSVTRLGIGDKLSVKIYERPDLSGEVTVRSDGTVSLPLIGAFSVEGRVPLDVERDIAGTLEKITGRPATLVVDVVEWRPIVVVGSVERPGTYTFKPHMTALHALASAGGPYRQSSLAGSRLEATREELIHYQNIEKLKTLLARQARIAAEREGKAAIEAPERLAELAGQADVEALLDPERRIMASRAASYKESEAAVQQKVELAGKETVLLKEQLIQAQEQVRLTKGELQDLQGLSERGITSRPRLLETQRLLASLESSTREIRAQITRAEQSQAAAMKEKSLLAIDRRLKLEEELRQVEEDLRTIEMALRASAKITGLGLKGANRIDMRVTYEVIRREGGKQVAVEIDESAELLPGDVVRISQGQQSL